jgi:glutathione S-transferase
MTSPRLAQETPSGRYYEDPTEQYRGTLYVSVTNVIGTAVGLQHYLTPWAANLAIEYIADHMEEWFDAYCTDRDAAVAEFKQRCQDDRDESWKLGDRIHTAAEAMLLGVPFVAEPDVQPYLDMLVHWLNAWGVTVEDVHATEISVVNRTYGYAGTADLMVWLPTGPGGAKQLWLIDFKTSVKHASTHYTREHKLQLAALANAECVWLPNGTELPMPKIERAGILNLRRARINLLPIEDEAAGETHRDAVRRGFSAFASLLAGTSWLHENQEQKRTPIIPPGTKPGLPHRKQDTRRPPKKTAARRPRTSKEASS